MVVTTISCTKEENNEMFFWPQTKCAEPWNIYSNNNEISTAITNYLNKEDIKVDNVQFDFDRNLQSLCEACTCTTGTKIIVTIAEGNSSRMEELGFEKI